MNKLGLGVYQTSEGKYIAKLGKRELGEFDSLEEAATAYNDQVTKVFAFPIYNPDGFINKEVAYEASITPEDLEETPTFNAALKVYLEEKRQEESQQKEETNDKDSEVPKLISIE